MFTAARYKKSIPSHFRNLVTMHILGFLGGLFLIYSAVQAQIDSATDNGKKIHWMTWTKAVEMQQKDLKNYNEKKSSHPPKKMFIDIYTGWCGWCKKMDASTFTDTGVAEYMNAHFYPVKMDAEMKDTLVYNGHTFVNPSPGVQRSTHQLPASLLDYQLSYPSFVLMDENINRLVIYKGYRGTEEFLTLLKFFGGNHHLTYKEYLQRQSEQSKQVPK